MPKSEFDLQLGDDDFTFKFRNPSRVKSGKYTVVISNDAGDTQEDFNANFLGEFEEALTCCSNLNKLNK